MLEMASADDLMLPELAAVLQASLHAIGTHVHPDDASREAARMLANDRDRGNKSEADRFRLPPSAGPDRTSTSPSPDAAAAVLDAMFMEEVAPLDTSSLTGANAKKRR